MSQDTSRQSICLAVRQGTHPGCALACSFGLFPSFAIVPPKAKHLLNSEWWLTPSATSTIETPTAPKARRTEGDFVF